ncbi:unnamed protein product [Nesidiocoris tenuis]|uniref:Uncharacterized protein n=1 Tax=Nesidiocoris tenuis TaxID=355587 RepID=A0A6H5HH20_9HEMI|nr:unnamed protein product [Nesidiocoris tenuis]
MLKKRKADGTDFYAALLEWWNTPTDGMNSSPTQRLIPVSTHQNDATDKSKLLLPEVVPDVYEALHLKRRKAKYFHDRQAKTLPDLEIGKEVLVRPPEGKGRWIHSEIEKRLNPSSYEVSIDGKLYCRSRSWLKPFHRATSKNLQLRFSYRPDIQKETSTSPSSPTERLSIQRAPERRQSLTRKSLGEKPGTPPESSGTTQSTPQNRSKFGRVVKKPERFGQTIDSNKIPE